MRRFISVLALLAVSGCGQAVAPTPAPEVSLLRNPTAPLASQVDVTSQDLDGSWRVRQAGGDFFVVGNLVRFSAREDALFFSQIPLIEGGSPDNLPIFLTFKFEQSGPGRWAGSSFEDPVAPDTFFWVHWMDFDRRTVALGDPDGRFVAILDRSATGGGDRIAAAREILDWYGYDTAKIVAP